MHSIFFDSEVYEWMKQWIKKWLLDCCEHGDECGECDCGEFI